MNEPTSTDRRTTLTWLLALAGAATVAACGGSSDDTPAPGPAAGTPPSPPPPPAPPPPPSSSGPITATTITSNLASPWGLAFLPDRRMLVTLKGGSLMIVSNNGQTVTPVSGVPAVNSSGQGGLLDVAIDPDFTTTPWVYLSYAENGTGGSGTAVARAQLVGTALQNLQVIFRQSNYGGGDHYGSRLVFRNDKTLFVTLGERQRFAPAQDLGQTLGKVVRINRDGSIPSDNPNLGAGALPGIWSYGHRNPQGAALHPTTGELWVSEHGPQGGDEINIARSGQNYGWPNVSYGCNYGASYPGTDNTSCRIGGGVHAPTYVEPLTYWVPTSQAPAGLAFYTGSMFPEWQGSLFSGALAGAGIWRLVLNGNSVASRERLDFAAINTRIRDVRQGPDGALYALTDGGSGRIVRIAR